MKNIFLFLIILCLFLVACTAEDNSTNNPTSSTSPQQEEEPSIPAASEVFQKLENFTHSATTTQGEFVATTRIENSSFTKNEPLNIYTTLTYIGTEKTIDIAHETPIYTYRILEKSTREPVMFNMPDEAAQTTTFVPSQMYEFHLPNVIEQPNAFQTNTPYLLLVTYTFTHKEDSYSITTELPFHFKKVL